MSEGAKKFNIIPWLMGLFAALITVLFTWVISSVAEGSKKDIEQDMLIQYNRIGAEASIKNNGMLCEFMLRKNASVEDRVKFCVTK